MSRRLTQEGASPHTFTDEEAKRAAEKAMSLLLYKDRTCAELREKLVLAGFSEKALTEAMEYVESFGYINDRRYAGNYVMFQRGKKSRKEIQYKLREKGVSKELIEEALTEDDGDGEETAIWNLVVKKLKGRELSELPYEERQKIIAYLGRKGYEFATIKKVFSKLDN